MGDFHFTVDRALAPHFRGMCGQYRHNHGIGKERREPGGWDTGLTRPGKCVSHCTFARCRSDQRMRMRAADVMLVLSDIGEMREKAKGANDLQRLLWRHTVKRRFKIAPRRNILVAAESNRVLPNVLHDFEDGGAALLADRVAEYSAEQPNIVAQRQIFVVRHRPQPY